MVQKTKNRIIYISVFFLLSLGRLSFAERTCHYSSFADDPKSILNAIKKYTNLGINKLKNKNLQCGIVTHHFLASNLIVDFFENLSANVTPKKIILIGPDHFNQGVKKLSFSSVPWVTPFGYLETDKKTIKKLNFQNKEDQEAFSGEHSIGLIIPFIKYYFPKTKIIPIIINVNIRFDSLIKLSEVLSKIIDDETFILLSMDFSHGKSSDKADKMDKKAKEIIQKLDYKNVWDLDIDCRPGLYLLLKIAKQMNVYFLNHTNSAKITKKNVQNCTSYFTILFEAL